MIEKFTSFPYHHLQAVGHARPTQRAPTDVTADAAPQLSLVIPGAGQMYKGKVGIGLVWLFFVVVGYAMFIVPGLILHVICVFNAASGKSK